MGNEQSKQRPGRPSAVGEARSRQLTFPVTDGERLSIVDAAVKSGKPLTVYIRDTMLAVVGGHFQSSFTGQESLTKPAKGNFQSQNGPSGGSKT